jgi:polyphosphate kinase 2 (PPK2 family)
MFETAELGRKLSKKTFKEREAALRQALLSAQFRLKDAPFPVIVLFAGVDGAGKGETIHLLNEWMDPRHIRTRSFSDPPPAALERPYYWRFWGGLPAQGKIGIVLSGWYTKPLLDRVYRRIDQADFDRQLEEIEDFEQTLTDDGALVLKFWMHLGRDAQEKRLKELQADPLLSWRVTEQDWEHWGRYELFVEAAERLISRTSVGRSPWHIVEGADHNYRSVRVAELLLAAMERRLEAAEREAAAPAPDPAVAAVVADLAPAPAAGGRDEEDEEEDVEDPMTAEGHLLTVLSRLDMRSSLGRKDYKQALAEQQARLGTLHRRALERGVTTVMVFEGWDAAGKGGAIRRCVAATDPRHVKLVPVAAPNDEEKAHHYLWRFWRHLPRAGRVLIYDRSWYGRVLVERVEGFARPEEWRRAYAEINTFESQLTAHGYVVLKFWLHITPEEQLRRFHERDLTPHKAWKLTDEDWRNRDRWPEYEQAVHDMVERTSTRYAPWTLVEANDKRFARVKVITAVCDALEAALERAGVEESAKKKKR